MNEAQCLRLLEKYSVPGNIVQHSLQVKKVAVFLAKKIRARGYPVNVALVRSGALLHDIGKLRSLKEKKVEHELSRSILEKEGLFQEAMIAFYHSLLQICSTDWHSWTLEQKVVHYADSRVMHDTIVSLQERTDDLLVRYPQSVPQIQKAIPLRKQLQEEILSKAGVPEGLEGLQ